MPIRNCRWEVRNPHATAGDFAGAWIRFQVDPPPEGRGGGPERRDISVTVSRSLIREWDLPEADHNAVLFWVAVYKGVVEGQSEVNLTTDNAPPACPPEWRRPEPPKGEAFEVEFPARPIGFKG